MNPFILLGIIGPWQIVLIVVIVLLLFGGKKIPELMRGIGKGARELKKGLNEDDEGTDTEKDKDKKDGSTSDEPKK
jgi:sec-independent protein translocase protein TatA